MFPIVIAYITLRSTTFYLPKFICTTIFCVMVLTCTIFFKWNFLLSNPFTILFLCCIFICAFVLSHAIFVLLISGYDVISDRFIYSIQLASKYFHWFSYFPLRFILTAIVESMQNTVIWFSIRYRFSIFLFDSYHFSAIYKMMMSYNNNHEDNTPKINTINTIYRF